MWYGKYYTCSANEKRRASRNPGLANSLTYAPSQVLIDSISNGMIVGTLLRITKRTPCLLLGVVGGYL